MFGIMSIWKKIISEDNTSVMFCALLIFLNSHTTFSFIEIPAKIPAVPFGASSMTTKLIANIQNVYYGVTI